MSISSALHTHSLFSAKEGSEHIASFNALRGVIHHVRRRKLKKILELGIGIGTIPYALREARLRHEITHNFDYYGTEADLFCIQAFKDNVPDYTDFVNHIQTLEDVSASGQEPFDFVIVDGRESGLEKLLDMLAKRGVIFVEGGRSTQIGIIESVAASAHRQFVKYSSVALSRRGVGGYSVLLFEPSVIDRAMASLYRIATPVKYRLALLFGYVK
jgi:hypothetical protein